MPPFKRSVLILVCELVAGCDMLHGGGKIGVNIDSYVFGECALREESFPGCDQFELIDIFLVGSIERPRCVP